VTRIALLADLHGARSVLEAVLAEADELGVDHVVVAGDYLECRISKRRAGDFVASAMADVDEVDPELWQLLERCPLVRGNQEERIDGLTAALSRSASLLHLLRAPASLRIAGLTVVHGHRFDWSRCADLLVPTFDEDLPGDRVLVFGHSHQALVTTLVPDADGHPWYLPSPVELGVVIPIGPVHRHLINLGPASTDDPLWALYDDADGDGAHASLTFRHVRQQVQL
jgi:predicted phosphodiesterase